MNKLHHAVDSLQDCANLFQSKTSSINENELLQLSNLFGCKKAVDDVRRCIQELDDKGDGTLRFPEYLLFMERMLLNEEVRPEMELLDCFRFLECEETAIHHGVGEKISTGFLKTYIRHHEDPSAPVTDHPVDQLWPKKSSSSPKTAAHTDDKDRRIDVLSFLSAFLPGLQELQANASV